MRGASVLFRPARRYKLRSPVITQSGSDLPLGRGMAGSVLVTEVIWQLIGPQLSVAETLKWTGVNRPVINQRILGVATMLLIFGGVESTTITVDPQIIAGTAPSLTDAVI